MQQKIIIGLGLTLIILIFVPLYWATEPERQQQASERILEKAMARGSELYAEHCASCHGAQGEGTIGPALKGTPLDEIVLHRAISRGIAGTGMPAFTAEEGGSMQEHQIDDLVIFIKNWQSAQPKPTPSHTTIPSEQGKVIFEQKCAACHSIGGGRSVGPDLKSITSKRDMDWLIRIIVSPEDLIAEGDPLAKQLLEEYSVPMPNVGLSEEEAKETLDYIKAQSEP